MYKIGLIGAGNLGSRHLQGLASIDLKLSIDVIDPIRESLDIAQERYNAVEPGATHEIRYLQNLEEIDNPDLAIIATNSQERHKVIESLYKYASPKYLVLEKFLFPHSSSYQAIDKLLTEHGVGAWVNCPRRLYPYYQQLKQDLNTDTFVNMEVSASNLRLASNAIHFLDLFAYLTGETDMEIYMGDVKPRLFPSKRSGYSELFGTIRGRTGRGSVVITSYDEGALPNVVKVETGDTRYYIQETGNPVAFKSSEHSQWEVIRENFKMPFQSQLTGSVVRQILEEGNTGLTDYSTSAQLHLAFLRALEEFAKSINEKEECLIT